MKKNNNHQLCDSFWFIPPWLPKTWYHCCFCRNSCFLSAGNHTCRVMRCACGLEKKQAHKSCSQPTMVIFMVVQPTSPSKKVASPSTKGDFFWGEEVWWSLICWMRFATFAMLLQLQLQYQRWFQGLPIMGPPYGKLPILFPYDAHIFRDSCGSGMGIVWVRGSIIGGPWKSLWQ